jgi:hypothetical protein
MSIMAVSNMFVSLLKRISPRFAEPEDGMRLKFILNRVQKHENQRPHRGDAEDAKKNRNQSHNSQPEKDTLLDTALDSATLPW